VTQESCFHAHRKAFLVGQHTLDLRFTKLRTGKKEEWKRENGERGKGKREGKFGNWRRGKMKETKRGTEERESFLF
jgi:hypothetical protein